MILNLLNSILKRLLCCLGFINNYTINCYLETLNENVEVIDISDCGIKKIKYDALYRFINLKKFYCNNNKLLFLPDFSLNDELKCLACSNNNLSTINLYRNEKLEFVDCSNNNINILELSNVKYLDCSYNNIDEIFDMESLVYLNCSKNSFIEFKNINNFINLKFLNCSYNLINNINISKLDNLEFLNCSNNIIENIYDIIECDSIKVLLINNNELELNEIILKYFNNLIFCDYQITDTKLTENIENIYKTKILSYLKK